MARCEAGAEGVGACAGVGDRRGSLLHLGTATELLHSCPYAEGGGGGGGRGAPGGGVFGTPPDHGRPASSSGRPRSAAPRMPSGAPPPYTGRDVDPAMQARMAEIRQADELDGGGGGLSEAHLAALEDAIRDALRNKRSVYEGSKEMLLRLFK